MLQNLIRRLAYWRQNTSISANPVTITGEPIYVQHNFLDADAPLCHVFKDILDDGVFHTLRLDKKEYYPIFEQLKGYWQLKLKGHGPEYILCPVKQLGKILHTPQDWLDVGYLLADATAQTLFNGSHSFVGDAVPALVDSGIVTTKRELERGITLLLQTLNPYQGGEHLFEKVAVMMKTGAIKSLDELEDLRVNAPRRVG